MGTLLARPTVARDGKKHIIISLWKYLDASLGRAVFIVIYKFEYKQKDIILIIQEQQQEHQVIHYGKFRKILMILVHTMVFHNRYKVLLQEHELDT